ncbi:MAG: TonB-dependent receptor [Gemmatimonadales bacterium]
MRRVATWLVLACLGLAPSLAAQVPMDTLPPDSLQRDTTYTTEKYLEEQAKNAVLLPVMPLVGQAGPLPVGSRVVLDRDSLDWALAETVGDLLQRVPGVYLWRGGWLGRTEYPNYRGRGPASVEYIVDGLPYLPLGPDSLGIDPSYFSLSQYERMEIEKLPGTLRVRLFSRRHATQAPGSRVGIASGDKSVARYIGALEYRWPMGIGLSLGGERMVAPTATGAASDFFLTNTRVALDWVPGTRFGVSAQLLSSSPERDPYLQTDTLEFGLKGHRLDAQLRAFWKSRPDELGLRVDGIAGITRWSGDGPDDNIRQGGVIVGWRAPRFGLTARAFNRSHYTPIDLSAEAGWSPLGIFTAALETGYQTHDYDRTSRWVTARSSLTLPLGFQFSGTGKVGKVVAFPTVWFDPEQDVREYQLTAGWQRSWFGVEGGFAHTAAFTPLAYRSFRPTIDSIAPAPATDWVTLNWRLQPKRWFTLEGWYSDPRGKRTPEGLPPTHSMTSATIRSKFWRTFKSGIFDFKATIAYETWGDGVIGRDSTGAARALDGASFWRTQIEIRLDSFMLYWDRYNLQASRKQFVPGFTILNFGSTFGVRWEFKN